MEETHKSSPCARIVDENGAMLPPGKHGEILVTGPLIMSSYLGNEKATLAAFDKKSGWLKTGDLGYFDANGKLYIADRLKVCA